MIYPDVPVEEWLKKYPTLTVIESVSYPCGCKIKADRPYITKDYAGLESRKCCDKGQSACSSNVAISKEENDRWNNLLETFI